MLNFFKLLGIVEQEGSREKWGSLFSDIEQLAGDLEERQILMITGLSGLLGKVAYSDRNISEEEIAQIEQLLTEDGLLEKKLFLSLIEVVKRHTKELSGIEDHRYLNILNEICTPEEKSKILMNLFALAAADNEVCSEEDRTLSLIAKGLRVPQGDYVAARRSVQDKLSVLKG